MQTIRTCNHCHKEMKLNVGIHNTNIAWLSLDNKPQYEDDDQILSICDNPGCPNYSLAQISAEQMPVVRLTKTEIKYSENS